MVLYGFPNGREIIKCKWQAKFLYLHRFGLYVFSEAARLARSHQQEPQTRLKNQAKEKVRTLKTPRQKKSGICFF